ncbi:MAG: S-methyl-5'-thioadenosine phosphorylase, partial [Pseudomonadota bacterium]
MKTVLGIIGGSGIYDLPGLENARWEAVETPWGTPSDALRFGEFPSDGGGDPLPMVFLPRHGRGHVLSPSGINYRANIDAMKRAGVTDLISVSAVGSFREDCPPGTFVLVDQYIDRTFARETSFFGNGCVAHVPFAKPVCPELRSRAAAAATALELDHRDGGTLVCIEGPQFSTEAESHLYRDSGCTVIGMTAMPEAKLAREAELPYATIAMVTDFDAWHPDHDAVDVAQVVATAKANASRAASLVAKIAADFPRERTPCSIGSDRALD